jgi:hypothetical protein
VTAPLSGIQRVRLDTLAVQLDERRSHTKAADLRHALDRLDDLADALDEAGDLIVALQAGFLAPERDRVLARIDALLPGPGATGRHAPNPTGGEA